MSKSTGSRLSRKAPARPKKPYADFPLYPHPLGYWSKKINGKILHFGRWGQKVKGVVVPLESDGWEDALKTYKARQDDARLGNLGPGTVVTEAPVTTDAMNVGTLCNHFRTAKLRQKEAGELTSRMYAEYVLMCDLLVSQFGAGRLVDDLAANDFAKLRAKIVDRWGPLRVMNGVTRVKSIFKFGFESGLIDRPPRYGQEFRPPSRSVLRRHKAKAPPKILESDTCES